MLGASPVASGQMRQHLPNKVHFWQMNWQMLGDICR